MYCCKNAAICFLKLQLSRMRGKLDLINYAYKLLQDGAGGGGEENGFEFSFCITAAFLDLHYFHQLLRNEEVIYFKERDKMKS